MIRGLTRACAQLKMRDNRAVDDKAMIALSRASPNLSFLSMVGCSRVSDYGFTSIAQNCINLKSIILKKRFSYAGGGVRATDDSTLCVYVHRLGGD